MNLKILADESVDFRIVVELANKGFEVISVLQNHQGILDKEVLELARQYNALLLTEDSDFEDIYYLAYNYTRMDIVYSIRRLDGKGISKYR